MELRFKTKNTAPILVSNLIKQKKRLVTYVLRKPKRGSWLQIALIFDSLFLCVSVSLSPVYLPSFLITFSLSLHSQSILLLLWTGSFCVLHHGCCIRNSHVFSSPFVHHGGGKVELRNTGLWPQCLLQSEQLQFYLLN